MSEHLLPKNLMERLARVDSKLEQLLAHQTLPQDEGLSKLRLHLMKSFRKTFSVASILMMNKKLADLRRLEKSTAIQVAVSAGSGQHFSKGG